MFPVASPREGSPTITVLCLHLGPRIHQGLIHFHVTVVGSQDQRRLLRLVARVHVRPMFDEVPRHLAAALASEHSVKKGAVFEGR